MEKLSEDAYTALVALAQHAYRAGQYAEALPLFRLLTFYEPEERSHWMGLGATLQMLGSYQAAIGIYGYAAILNENDPYVHLYAAECFHAIDNDERAILALDSALLTAQQAPQNHLLVEQLQLLRKQWEGGKVHHE